MKKVKLLLLITMSACVLLLACKKDKADQQDATDQSNQSKLIVQKSGNGTPAADQSPFVIHSAGLYQGYLYMSVSFTGGETAHEFTVSWDGNIIDKGVTKEIDLVVYQPNVYDPGTSMVFDSIAANILETGISSEELDDPMLWIRVTNGSNPENFFYFKASYEYVDPLDITNSRDVKVTREGCSDYGIWGDLWLVTNDAGPVSHYFVMEIDNSVSYTPVENDLLKIDFSYTYLTDSSKVCTQLSQMNALPVKILKISK